MSAAGGYIKLHRKITRWEWYDDPETFRVFIHLLLMANYEDKRWHGILVRRGQLLTSRKTLAKETHLSEQKIRTALNHLKSTNEITIQSTNKWSLITVEKYSDYQVIHNETNQQDNQQANHQPTSNQPQHKKQKEGKEKKNVITTARARTREDVDNYVDNSRVVVEEKGFSLSLYSRLTDEEAAALEIMYQKADDLIHEVDGYVREKGIAVRYPARYIQGYARRCGWPER